MSTRTKSPEDARQFMRAVANHQGWALNPDDAFLSDLAEGLARNYNAYGYYLCPCRDGDNDREADHDIICPCDYARADIDEYGHCFCGLFLSREFASGDRTPRPIPERRAGGI
jgi:ferredoxin-thioredoxin reductase catalytic chain